MNRYLKELVLWAFIIAPYVYLYSIWDGVPEQVPTHFDIKGQPDDWSGKNALIYLPAILGVGIYILMLFIPRLDPKRKLEQMGGNYYRLRVMFTVFFSILTVYMLYISKMGSMENPGWFVALLGVFFAMMGNYLQAVRPNYFIGIRTPWTLENSDVWKKTHHLGGRLWMAGGILIAVLALIIKNNVIIAFVFGTLLVIMVIVPVVYSYMEFKRRKSNPDVL